MSKLSRDNPRELSIASLITTGLGYCCEAYFWERFKNVSTELIAARLGVTERAVRTHRAAYRQGEFECQKNVKCKV